MNFELSGHPVFELIKRVSIKSGIKAYVVGGYVRDLILKIPSKDIDVTVIGSGIEFAEWVGNEIVGWKNLSVFKNFGTASLKFQDYEVEFVGARKESYSIDSRNPTVEEGTLEDDIFRRDLTINALAISLNQEDYGQLIDLCHGYDDIVDGYVITPLDPDITFSDDPLRMLRAIRFTCRLDFDISNETFDAILRNSERIKIISQERITDELNKIIMCRRPSKGFILLEQTGLLNIIFPEFVALKGVKTVDNKSHKDNFYHTLQVLDNIAPHTKNLWLRWAAILHDIGKPATQRYDNQVGWTFHGHEVVGSRMVKKIFTKLRLPLYEEMKYVEKLVLLHLRPISLTFDVSDAAIRRIVVDAGEDLDDLITLCKADITSKNIEKVTKFTQRFDELVIKIKEVEERDALRNWKNPITGEMIMDYFKLSPCRKVGDIKEFIKEAIMNGDVPNNFEDAFSFLKTIEIDQFE